MTRLIYFIFLVLTMLARPALAKAPGDPADQDRRQPMRVVVVRLADPACEPDCAKWISAEGDITEDTPGVFRRVLKQTAKTPLPIFIQSRGGNVDAALEIGRMIRKAGLDIAVTQTKFEGCEPGAKGCALKSGEPYRGRPQSLGAYCFSACPYLVAGGKRRFIPGLTRVGVHQVEMTHVSYRELYRIQYQIIDGKKKEISRTFLRRETVSKTKEAPDPNSETYRKIDAYLVQMDVSARLRNLALTARHDEIRMLTPGEMREIGLQTHALPGEVLINKAFLTELAAEPSPAPRAPDMARAEPSKSPPPVQIDVPKSVQPDSNPMDYPTPIDPRWTPAVRPDPAPFDPRTSLLDLPELDPQSNPILRYLRKFDTSRGSKPVAAEPDLSASLVFDLEGGDGGAGALVIEFSNQKDKTDLVWRASSQKNDAFVPDGVSGLAMSAGAKQVISPVRLHFPPNEAVSQGTEMDRAAFCDLASLKPVRLTVALGGEAQGLDAMRFLTFYEIHWRDDKLLTVCAAWGQGEASVSVN